MLNKRKNKDHGRERTRRKRAAIYLRGLDDSETHLVKVPSINTQRRFCRYEAKELHAEVVDEFVDLASTPLPHPGMEGLLERLAHEPRLDYLIVYSLDRLVPEREGAFIIGRHLGSTGTVLVSWAHAYESALRQMIAD
jgi:DNA invertase Pin-like site-specific DNA recombinase